jgi:Cdc6-like AAA superfamily ATPase
MTDHEKKEIQMLLKTFVEGYPSQRKASDALRNVSEATIINIRRGDWESISDDMWRNVGKQVGYNHKTKWQMVETVDFKRLVHYFDDAREYGTVFAITAPAGSGKSFTAEWYESKRQNIYLVSCTEYMNRRDFLEALLSKMGKAHTGLRVSEMMETIVDTLLKKENPLIILDEFDKVSDSILYFFITFYNRLAGNAGIIIMATEFLALRINKGRKKCKKGYSEIYSRIGRRFMSIRGTDENEVKEICRANGISDVVALSSIYNECEGDLRRVNRGVHKYKMKALKKAA